MQLAVRRLTPDAVLPSQQQGWWILRTPTDIVLQPSRRTTVSTEIELVIQKGVRATLSAPPSSVTDSGDGVLTVVDQSFDEGPTGEILVRLARMQRASFSSIESRLPKNAIIARMLFYRLAFMTISEIPSQVEGSADQIKQRKKTHRGVRKPKAMRS